MRVLLAATGSVAAVKVPQIALELMKFAEVRVILTKAAKHFVELSEKYNPAAFKLWEQVINSEVVVYTDDDEWWSYREVSASPVLHIELRKWADLLLVAPLSANTLAKLANGICDNLLTNVARAWDLTRPVVVAPAMNTLMWSHPFTKKHLEAIQELGYHVISPQSKLLACGDMGVGGLAQVDEVVAAVKDQLSYAGDVEKRDHVWAIEIVEKDKLSASEYTYALAQLKTSEAQLGSKHRVVSVSDYATKVVFAYAIFTNSHKKVSVVNLSRSADIEKTVEDLYVDKFVNPH